MSPKFDEGRSMRKLYKSLDGVLHYLETWNREGVAVIHSGRVGDRGTTRELRPEPGENAEAVMSRELAGGERQGYSPIKAEDHASVVVQYSVEDWETDEALGLRHTVEEILNDALGWSGNGHCDGGDISRKTINVWCKVVDLESAKQTIISALQYNGLRENVVLAASDNRDHSPFYPANYPGRFKL
jgi:hypothetical protein